MLTLSERLNEFYSIFFFYFKFIWKVWGAIISRIRLDEFYKFIWKDWWQYDFTSFFEKADHDTTLRVLQFYLKYEFYNFISKTYNYVYVGN